MLFRSGGAGAPGRKLHEHLAHLRFLHAGLPDLVEKIQVTAHDGRIVQIGDPVPAIYLQSVYQRLVIRDDECAGARGILRTHGTQVDAAGQAACQGEISSGRVEI